MHQRLLCTCLKHVVKKIQLNDGLAFDQVIHHGSVNVAHDVDADADNEALEQVNDLCWE